MIIIVLSIGLSELAYFHLISHALFKSLLFLCAGYFIHSRVNCQDIRFIGGLYESFPVVNFYFVGCSLSLCGFPFLAGFYSKDLILENYFFEGMNSLIFILIIIGTIFTITYSVRLYYYLYVRTFKGIRLDFREDFKIASLYIVVPITVLFIFSVIVGSWFNWNFVIPRVLTMPWFIKIAVLIGIIRLVFLIGRIKVRRLFLMLNKSIGVSDGLDWFLGHIWFLPYVSTFNPIKSLLSGKFFYRFMDNGWLEFLGGQEGMAKIISLSRFVDRWNILSIKLSFCFLLLVLLIGVIL